MSKDSSAVPPVSATAPSPLESTPPFTFPISFSTQYTFPQIIDADHFTITGLARRIRSPTTLKADLKPLILEATWRLIRHDLSEDLVMRPAFALHMGPTGAAMAEHDRQDHAQGRQVLVDLINSDPDFDDAATMARVLEILGDLFDELGQHMAVESGEHIPKFCGIIDEDTSRRLAREYAVTLCMTPYVVRVVEKDGTGKENQEPVFTGGVKEYVNADMTTLTKLYESVIQSARHDRGKCLKKEVEREIERLKIGKWLGYNERKALKEGRGAGMGKL